MTNKEKEQRIEAKAKRINSVIYKKKKNKIKEDDFLEKLKEFDKNGN